MFCDLYAGRYWHSSNFGLFWNGVCVEAELVQIALFKETRLSEGIGLELTMYVFSIFREGDSDVSGLILMVVVRRLAHDHRIAEYKMLSCICTKKPIRVTAVHDVVLRHCPVRVVTSMANKIRCNIGRCCEEAIVIPFIWMILGVIAAFSIGTSVEVGVIVEEKCEDILDSQIGW